MKAKILSVIAILGAFCLIAETARAQTNFTYTSGSLNLGIPDQNTVGISSSTTLSGVAGYISSVQVTLNITGGFNGDLYAYLMGPQGSIAVLLNRVGLSGSDASGYGDAGFNITLSDGFPDIHNYQSFTNSLTGGQLTGAWSADGRNISPLSAGSSFDTAPITAGLGVFNNLIPNGAWTLFISDLSGGSSSTLVSWGMTIVTVPEPQTWALLASGASLLFTLRRRSR